MRLSGLALSPDEKLLQVVDSGISHGGPAHIRVSTKTAFVVEVVYSLGSPTACVPTSSVTCCSTGWADPSEDGVRCYAPDGTLIGKVHLPETCANLCFGGKTRNRLFMCASEDHGTARVPRRTEWSTVPS